MQSTHETVHITPTEWRWVIILGGAFVILAFVPFLWVGFSGANNSQWQFMGVLNNYIDGATYLSKMMQGYEGSWLIHFRHTSEPHNAMFIQVIWATFTPHCNSFNCIVSCGACGCVPFYVYEFVSTCSDDLAETP